MDTARCIIEVNAGLVHGKAEPEYTRRYSITSAEWNKARESKDSDAEISLLAERSGMAQGYASMLMLHSLNWVRVDWIWM